MSLMGHKDLKTTMRYIRAVQLQRQVRSQNSVHKLATQKLDQGQGVANTHKQHILTCSPVHS